MNFHFPPRGSGIAGVVDSAPRSLWQPPEHLNEFWTYDETTPGAVLIGRFRRRLLGRTDDRHVVTIAGSRAGKSQTVIIPNLKRYRGSVVVIDPKGELAQATASIRESWGHRVFILNPFGVLGWGTHGHNPCAELLRSSPEAIPSDTAQLADALIIDNSKDAHWTDSAKNLVTGLLLHTLTTAPQSLSIGTLRSQISRTDELPDLFEAMALNDTFNGVIQNIGLSFLAKFHSDGRRSGPNDEMLSVLATANAQTRPLDDLSAVFARHDFDLRDISEDSVPTTIYLILPATKIPTHARWLRLFVYQLIAALERKPIARDRLPLWLILEEFAALGHMRSVEAAAGYFAGFGVKLWTILQDLTQIKTHYKDSLGDVFRKCRNHSGIRQHGCHDNEIPLRTFRAMHDKRRADAFYICRAARSGRRRAAHQSSFRSFAGAR